MFIQEALTVSPTLLTIFSTSHSLQLLGDLSEQPMRQKLLFSHPTEEGTGKVARCQMRKENWRNFLDPVPVLLQDETHGTKTCGGAPSPVGEASCPDSAPPS